MLECHACLRHCLQALLAAPRRTNASYISPAVTRWDRPLIRALQTEATSTAPRADDPDPPLSRAAERPHNNKPFSNAEGTRPQTWYEAVGAPRKKSLQTSPKKPLKTSHLKTELKWLRDPAKLADHVLYVLQKTNDEERALALCRMSSKALANTVSWNHLINWQMQNGKTNAAFSTFSEMKKRAQKPDSYTYLLLLRGLANYAHHPNSLTKALSLYHSIKSPNSNLQPNIIHTNAVLKVCARANDMDSLWDIASQLPERGPHSANSWTFTTILNYLRMNLLSETQDDPQSETSLRRTEEVVVKGKQLWSVIVARWRQGELTIDEGLVCSMGRLLLAGNKPRDWDNVLSLIQQTMNITRLEPRLGTVARDQSGAPKIRAPSTPDDLKDNPSEMTLHIGAEEPDSIFDAVTVPPEPRDFGRHVPSITKRGRRVFAFAQPGNSTLSLVLEACQKTIIRHAARGYWDLLTDPSGYAIKPDLDNVHMMLRNHRRAGASNDATELVEDLPRLNLPPDGRTFWLAMTACQRDQGNPAARDNARRLLDTMQRTLSVPNIKTLSIFLELARQTQQPAAIVAALQRIWPSVLNLKSLLSFGDYSADFRQQSPARQHSYRIEAYHLVKTVLECYNYLLRRNVELGSLHQTYTARRATLKAFLERDGGRPMWRSLVLNDKISSTAPGAPRAPPRQDTQDPDEKDV